MPLLTQKHQQTHEIPEASALVFFTKFWGESADGRRFEWHRSLTGGRDKFYIIYNSYDESFKHILKGCPFLCHQYVPSHLIIPGLSEEEHLCFRYYSFCIKAQETPPNACALIAFKKTLSGKELALFPLLLLLRHDTCTVSYFRHIKELSSRTERGKRLTMYSRSHCLDSRAQHHLSLKKEAENNNNMWVSQS